MSFFKKLKNKLFKSSAKLDEGLDAIVSDGGVEETVEVEISAPEPDTAALEAEAQARAAEAEAVAEQERLAAEQQAAEKAAAEAREAEERAAQEAAERAAAEKAAAAQAAEDARRAEEQRAAEEAEARAAAEAEAKAQAEAEAEQARLAAEAAASKAAAEEAARKAAEDAANAKASEDAKAAAARAEALAAEERAAAEAEAARQAAAQAEAERQAKEAAEQAERDRQDAEAKAAAQKAAEQAAAAEAAKKAEADAKAEQEARAAAEAAEAAAKEAADKAEQAAKEAQDEAARALEQAKANVAADLSAPAAAALLAGDDAPQEPAKKPGLLGRLLGRKETRTVLRRELDDDMLEALEELLIASDMGVDTALRVTANMAEGRLGKKLSTQEIKELLASEITTIMEPVAKPMPLYPKRPQVVLVVGVNGSGKTTTIGKLASQFQQAGKKVVIAAGDTFRAAAVEQLQVWGDRAGVPVLTAPEGSDPASLAFDAMTKAEESGADLLMIDTAGRLQNRSDLMEELAKIVRVIRKKDDTAPHNTLLVLDATTGQNALNQVKVFQEISDVSGLVMTKLDGTAKGGVLVALADKFGLPIHAIGVGEQIDDLDAFDPQEFAQALTGVAPD